VKAFRFKNPAYVLITALALLTIIGWDARPAAAQTKTSIPKERRQYIVATVNKKPITRLDWDERVRVALMMADLPITPANSQQVALPVLRNLVEEQVKLQEADRLNLSVGEDEVGAVYASIEQANQMPSGGLTKLLQDRQVSAKAYRDEIRTNLLWRKVVQRAVIPEVQVSGEEVVRLRQRKLSLLDQPTYQLSEIVLSGDDATTNKPIPPAVLRDTAKRLLAALNGGANFGKLAKQFSNSASAADNGNLGWVAESLLADDQRALLADQTKGRIFPLEREREVILYWLQDVRQPDASISNAVAMDSKQILLPAATSLEQALAVRQQLIPASCDKLEAALKDAAGDKAGDRGKIVDLTGSKLADYPRTLSTQLVGLPINGITTPTALADGGGYTMLKLCQLNADAVAGLTSKELTAELRQEKIQRNADQYLRTLKRNARIEIKAGG
jgi:peptidyl-prolyl cis-trans isomerase SurA